MEQQQSQGNLQIIDENKVVEKAQHQAKLLIDIVEKQELYAMIKGNKFLQVEAWELIGAFHQMSAVISSVEEVEREDDSGFKAEAVLKDIDGNEVGKSVAYCMKGEDNWAKKPMYQLASMAQTRAVSKAFRLKYSFVAALAGYETTPAEEITKEDIIEKNVEKQKQTPKSEQLPKKDLEKARKATFAKVNELGIDDDDFTRYCCDKFGVETRADMTYDDFKQAYKDLLDGTIQERIFQSALE